MKKLLQKLLVAAIAAVTLASCDILSPEDPGLLVPLTVTEDASLPSISVNGTQLHSEAFGNPDDPMIVVMHGGPGGDYRGMLNCANFSANGFYVVFYDQRGSGLSQRLNKDAYQTVQVFIDELDGVIKHYRRRPDQKVILMGHSWGAMLASAYINEYPAAVSGAVLMEPGGLTWPDAEAYIKRFQDLSLFDETANDYFYLDQILTGEDHVKLDYKAALKSAADFAPGNKLGIAGPYPKWRNGSVCNTATAEYARAHSFDFTTNLRQYTTKVLFLYSELNQAYGKAHAEHVSSAYPNVDLVEITGTGHEIPYFGWEKMYPVTLTYLNSVK